MKQNACHVPAGCNWKHVSAAAPITCPIAKPKAKRDAEYREQQKKNPHAGGIKTDWVYSYNATDFQPKALQV
jgi:hypothetical protein